MTNTPRNKAQARAAIQANNPLDGVKGNLDAEVPDEFRAPGIPLPTAAEMAAFREWQAMHIEQVAQETVEAITTGKPVDALVLSPEQKVAISESGRAPKVSDKDRVWIILDDNDEIPPGGQFIGVNGVGYNLIAGVEAFVPRAVCEVLDHAVKSVPVQDQMTKRIIGWKQRKRFPYSVVNKRAERIEA